MPLDGPLPKTGDSQDIDADAQRCFMARRPRGWLPHELMGTDDYGLDYNVQIAVNQQVTDVFRVQLKGSRSPTMVDEGRFFAVTFNATTIRLYDRIPEPILLVFCDLTSNDEPADCELFYVWVPDELRRRGVATLPQDQTYVTLRVPVDNRLRGADLTEDIRRRIELSRAGHAMDLTVERTHPEMDAAQRLNVVQGIGKSVSARSAAFIDALSAAASENWINPAQGSLPWLLQRAKTRLAEGKLERAGQDLDAVADRLTDATPLERADFQFLRGKLLSATGADLQASEAYEQAYAAHASGKYLAAWAESVIRARYDGSGAVSFSDVLERLVGDDPQVLSARSRALAAEGKREEALAVAQTISGAEGDVARALAYTVARRPGEADAECERGLAVPNLADSQRQLLLLVRARSRFAIAMADGPAPIPIDAEHEAFPPSGRAAIDPAKLRTAWEAIQESKDALRDAGWPSNIDHLADIWGAAASLLGKQAEILPELAAAARGRGHLSNVQAALEAIAAQSGDFETALEANSRLPATTFRELKKTLFLSEADRHFDCAAHFEPRFAELDREHFLFGPAVVAAAISAHRVARTELAERWAKSLDDSPSLREHAASLRYWLSVEASPLSKAEALSALESSYTDLDRPLELALVIFQERDPADKVQAPKIVEAGDRIREKTGPARAMSPKLAMALATMEDWPRLLALCAESRARFESHSQVEAFEALALDRVGRTEESRQLLQRMVDSGLANSMALNTYVVVMLRCGYAKEAVQAAERLQESAKTREQKLDRARLLFKLIHHSDPSSPRLLPLAMRMAELTQPDSEAEEGVLIQTMLMATLSESNRPTPEQVATFQSRAEAFFTKFPGSKIVRRAQLPNEASAEETVALLKTFAGFSEEGEKARRRFENQLRLGTLAAPYFIRPLLMLQVRDVAHLWEIAKLSGPDDKQYHLAMVTDTNWRPVSANALRERTPLVDMTALQVLRDLGLIDVAFDFFGKVAIAKSTLESLADMTHPLSGSPARGQCLALQDSLKRHLSAIEQPSAGTYEQDAEDMDELGDFGSDDDSTISRALGRENGEIARLCRERRSSLRLYSDDLAFRALCDGEGPDAFCTLDLILALRAVGMLTKGQLAASIAQLSRWRVALVVRLQEFVAMIPDELLVARSLREGIDILDAHKPFVDTFAALYDFRGSFATALGHAGVVLRTLAASGSMSVEALSALMAQWHVKAGFMRDAPAAEELATSLTLKAALEPPVPVLTPETARALWAVYKALVEFRNGDRMDVGIERAAIRRLGEECAKLPQTSRQEAFDRLRKGITTGTADDADFAAGFARGKARGGGSGPGSTRP